MITDFAVKQGIISKFLSLDFHGLESGVIHSIFKSSFNVSVNQHLIHFDSLEKPLSAFGVNIPQDVLDKLIRILTAGDIVRIKDNDLTIYAKDSKLIRVKFKDLFYKDLRLKELVCNKPLLQASPLVRAITGIEFEKHIGLPYGKEEIQWLEKLKKNSCSYEFTEGFVRHFLGRGKGLTPSGDDFIMGYIMMLYVFRKEEFVRWKLVLEKLLSIIKTTDVSFNYYRAMLEGYTSQQFHEFTQSLFYEVDTQTAQNLINNLLAYGSSSGYDTLFGIYTALNQIIF